MKKENIIFETPKKEKRSVKLTIRLTKNEYEKIQNLVNKTSLKTAVCIRKLALGYEIKSKFDDLILYELFKLRGDINRLGGLFKFQLNELNNDNKKNEILIINIRKNLENIEKLSHNIKNCILDLIP